MSSNCSYLTEHARSAGHTDNVEARLGDHPGPTSNSDKEDNDTSSHMDKDTALSLMRVTDSPAVQAT